MLNVWVGKLINYIQINTSVLSNLKMKLIKCITKLVIINMINIFGSMR